MRTSADIFTAPDTLPIGIKRTQRHEEVHVGEYVLLRNGSAGELLSMQHAPPASQQGPPTHVRSGCGELKEKATQAGPAEPQHSATQASSVAFAPKSGCDRKSPPYRMSEGGSSVGAQAPAAAVAMAAAAAEAGGGTETFAVPAALRTTVVACAVHAGAIAHSSVTCSSGAPRRLTARYEPATGFWQLSVTAAKRNEDTAAALPRSPSSARGVMPPPPEAQKTGARFTPAETAAKRSRLDGFARRRLFLPLAGEGRVPFMRLLAWKAVSALRAREEEDEAGLGAGPPDELDMNATSSSRDDGVVVAAVQRLRFAGFKFRTVE